MWKLGSTQLGQTNPTPQEFFLTCNSSTEPHNGYSERCTPKGKASQRSAGSRVVVADYVEQLIEEIETKAAASQQQISLVRSQLAAKQRESRLLRLTLGEVEGLPESTRAYEGVGRMCVEIIISARVVGSCHCFPTEPLANHELYLLQVHFCAHFGSQDQACHRS